LIDFHILTKEKAEEEKLLVMEYFASKNFHKMINDRNIIS
jgi:hypothetical protein